MLAMCRTVALAFVVLLIGGTLSADQKSSSSGKVLVGTENDATPETGSVSTRPG